MLWYFQKRYTPDITALITLFNNHGQIKNIRLSAYTLFFGIDFFSYTGVTLLFFYNHHLRLQRNAKVSIRPVLYFINHR
jgi:hypothetical protein